MKNALLFTFVLVLFSQFSKAQMDDKFYQPSKILKPIEFKNFENISLPVESDTITAIVLRPETKSLKKTILFFHGAGGNVTSYQFMVKPLVEVGYQVVMVDLRGYGKSTGTPTHLNVAADAQKFFDAMLVRPDIKNNKIYIYGASLGTQVATKIAKDNQNKISGLIIDGGMSSFTDIAAHFAPQYKDVIEKMLISPYSVKEDIKALKGLPKLFIYGSEDKTVPFEQGKTNFANAAEPKQFLEYKGDHLLGIKVIKDDIIKAISNL